MQHTCGCGFLISGNERIELNLVQAMTFGASVLSTGFNRLTWVTGKMVLMWAARTVCTHLHTLTDTVHNIKAAPGTLLVTTNGYEVFTF